MTLNFFMLFEFFELCQIYPNHSFFDILLFCFVLCCVVLCCVVLYFLVLRCSAHQYLILSLFSVFDIFSFSILVGLGAGVGLSALPSGVARPHHIPKMNNPLSKSMDEIRKSMAGNMVKILS